MPGEFGQVTYNFVWDVCSTLKIVCVYYIFVTLLIGGNKDSYSILSCLILSYPLSSWWNTNYLMPVPLHRFVCVICSIRPVWSESSLPAWWNTGSSATHWAHSEGSDQTGRMPRPIWVFTGRTCHFVGCVVRWFIYHSLAHRNLSRVFRRKSSSPARVWEKR